MTGNFYVKNATFIYAIEPPTPEEDEFFWDDFEINIKEKLQKIGFKPETEEKWEGDNTKILATKEQWDKTGTYSYQIQATIRSGYYSGANLDYELKFEDYDVAEDEGLDWRNIKDSLDNIEPDKPHARQSHRIEKELREALNKDLNKLERIYWDNSVALIHVASFSNGEGVYKPAKQFYAIKTARITAKNRA